MRRLPLFPLPVVLFPGAVTPLHIFEPRYRQMVARCIEYDRRFGLLYHDPDRLGPFERTPGRVGTIAEIGEFRILPDGRSLLLATGIERFRIVDGIESDTKYHEALVEPLVDGDGAGDEALGKGGDAGGEEAWRGEPDAGTREEALMQRRQRTLSLLDVVVDRLGLPGEDPEATEAIPPMDPAEEVSFRVAAMIQTDPMWQHGLLSLTRESARLDRIDALLRDTLAAGDPTQDT
jgi:Lon protease-like protein